MQDDRREKVAAPDKGGHFDKVRREAADARTKRVGKEAGSRPGINLSRPLTR